MESDQNSNTLQPEIQPEEHEMPKPKSKVLLYIVVLLTLIGLAGGGFWAYQNYVTPTKQSNESYSPIPTVIVSPIPEDIIEPTAVLEVKTLQYHLPVGWKVIQDKSGFFEFGYDSTKYETAVISDNRIDLKYVENGFFGGTVRIIDYDGRSRHVFLLNASGAGGSFDKSDEYNEKDFQKDNRSCLLISGAYVSASQGSWMMCDIGGGKAVFINAEGETETISLMSSVKILK